MPVVPFTKKYLIEAEEVLKDNPDFFSFEDCKLFKKELLEYLSLPSHRDKERRIWVIENNGKFIGIAVFHKRLDSVSYYQLVWLAIKRDEQRKGFGTKLLTESIKDIKDLGGEYIYLETADVDVNLPTLSFYRKLGFEKSGILPAYYPPSMKGVRKDEDLVSFSKRI